MYIIFSYAPIQCFSVNPQCTCCTGLVPTGSEKGFLKPVGLQQSFLMRYHISHNPFFLQLRRQVMQANDIIQTNNTCMLNGMGQFTDIARPVMS